jgi:hypothetical protein
VGKYSLDEETKKISLLQDEDIITSTDLVYYTELLYIVILFVSIAGLLIGIIGLNSKDLFILLFTSIGVLLILCLMILLLVSATRIEFVFLTTERIIIKYYGILEKFLRVRRESTLSLDQVAIISFGRAPLNRGALITSFLGFVVGIFPLFFLSDNIFAVITGLLIVGGTLWLFFFGLRLNRQTLDIHTVGMVIPFRIGQVKGLPRGFVDKVHQAIFERVHHRKHTFPSSELLSSLEFPLETSHALKKALERVPNELGRKLLLFLDNQSAGIDLLVENFPDKSRKEIEKELKVLEEKDCITFQTTSEAWVAVWNM